MASLNVFYLKKKKNVSMYNTNLIIFVIIDSPYPCFIKRLLNSLIFMMITKKIYLYKMNYNKENIIESMPKLIHLKISKHGLCGILRFLNM